MTPFVALVLLPGSDDAGLLRTARSVAAAGDGPWTLVVPAGVGSDHARDEARHLLGRRHVQLCDHATPGDELGAAFDRVTAAYVGLLGGGDEVEAGVLRAVVDYLTQRPDVDVLYTDEQWPAPGITGIAAKPHWVPHYLEGWDFLGRLCVLRRSLVAEVGGLRSEVPRAVEWDVHLRVTERTDRVEHLPLIGVTRVSGPARDPETVEDGRRAVEARYARLDVPATVELTGPEGYVRAWRTLDDPPLVSIVVPTGGGRREVGGVPTLVVETCVRSLVERTTYDRWELVLVPSEGTPPEVVELVRSIVGERLVVAPVTGEFSFSHSVNEGVRVARGDLVLLLNDDTEVVEPRWLDRLVSVAADPRVGVVGAKLLYEDGTIQHVGIIHDDEWLPIHAHRLGADDDSHFGAKVVDVDYLAVTGACLMTPRGLYLELGGFSTELPMAFNDVDYCYKVVAAGYGVVCTPFATLFHYESTSRVADVRPFERRYLEERTTRLAQVDPHINHRSAR